MSSKLSFTDINEWYTSLNTLRNKENISLGSITVPNLKQKQAKATDINDYISKLNALRTNEYFKHATWITISPVSSKDQIKEVLKSNISTELGYLNDVCANFSKTTSNITNDCSTFTCSKSCKTNQTTADTVCITNSTNTTCSTNQTCNIHFDGWCSQFSDGSNKTTNTCETWVCQTYTWSTKTFKTNSSGGGNTTNSTFSESSECQTFTCKTTTTHYDFSVVANQPIISNSKVS